MTFLYNKNKSNAAVVRPRLSVVKGSSFPGWVGGVGASIASWWPNVHNDKQSRPQCPHKPVYKCSTTSNPYWIEPFVYCHVSLKNLHFVFFSMFQPQPDSVAFISGGGGWSDCQLCQPTSMKSLQKNVFRHQHYSIEDLIACPDLPALLEWGEFRWQFFFISLEIKT